jgi:uncharacterized repeat protein (TIGR01451 family)
MGYAHKPLAGRPFRTDNGATGLPRGGQDNTMKTENSLGRRAGLALVAVLALVWAGAALAGGASTQQNVNPTGGAAADASDGLRWLLGSNSQFQVYLGGNGQVFNPSATPVSGNIFNSVYLRVDRGTNATTRVYHNSNTASGVTGTLPFTQTSQSGISGSGTAASPWEVTTVLTPSHSDDGGITVTIVDSYIRPQMWLTRRVTISGMPASGADIKFYQNIDTYLQGGDSGPGFTRTSAWNTTGTPDIVGVIKGEQFQALWYEPSSGTPHWDRYFSGNYLYPGRQICRGADTTGGCLTGTGNLSNQINTNPTTDNGMAVQWDIPAGASTFTVEYRVTFAMGAVDLTKEFEPEVINAGDVSTLIFGLNNRTVNAVASINLTDTMPAEVQVAPDPNIRSSCPAGGPLTGSLPPGMTVVATPGSNVIQITGASVNGAPTGGELLCQIAVDVTSDVVGEHHNTNASISGTNNLVNLVGDEVLTVVQPQLAASKSVEGTLVPGQSGTSDDGHYLIGIENTGTGATVGTIDLVDTLPAGFSAVAASSVDGTIDCGTLPATGTLTCSFTPAAPIEPGASATVRINVAIESSASGSATNVVAVGGGGDPDPLPACPDAGNLQCAEDTTPLSPEADLQITKSNESDAVLSGEETVYQIVVSNLGPSDADGAVVKDTPDTGLSCTAVSCGDEQNGAVCPVPPLDVNDLTGSGIAIPTLPAGGSVKFQVTCTVD